MESSKCLVIVVLAACLVAGHANLLTGTGFPYECCRQDPWNSLYSTTLDSYMLNPEGSEACFKIHVKNQTLCRAQNPPSRNQTVCCDVGFNKFKIFPNQSCKGALKQGTIQRPGTGPVKISYSSQTMSGGIWVIKFTALGLTPQTADGAILCVQLKAPCPTLAMYSYDSKVLEVNLYDEKLRKNYECCPANAIAIPQTSFDKNISIPKRAPDLNCRR